MPFGSYSKEGAERAKDRVDLRLTLVEGSLRRLGEAVPGAAHLVDRIDQLMESAQEIASEQRELIDQRTDTEAVAKW